MLDDEKASLNRLKKLVEKCTSSFKVVGEASSVPQAKRILAKTRVDIVFLDVEMPGENGFDFLRSIQERNFLVVFVTAYDYYAVRAFEANAIDYLIKPVQPEDLVETEKRLAEKKAAFENSLRNGNIYDHSLINIEQNVKSDIYPKQILINNLNGFILIDIDNIVYLESSNYYTFFHLNNNKSVVSSRGLYTYKKILNPDQFFQTHRSIVINLDYLKGTSSKDGYFAILKHNYKVEVSRRRKNDFMAMVKSRLHNSSR